MAAIAFIGLGNMGAPMAANLVRAGHSVAGHDLSPAAREAGAAAGVAIKASGAEAAAGADVVVTSLADGPGGYKLALDGAGGDVLRELLHHLAPYGVVATYGAMAGPATIGLADLLATANPRIVGLRHDLPPDQRGADLGVLARLVGSGALTPRLGVVDDWSTVRETLEEMAELRVRGKVVLTLS